MYVSLFPRRSRLAMIVSLDNPSSPGRTLQTQREWCKDSTSGLIGGPRLSFVSDRPDSKCSNDSRKWNRSTEEHCERCRTLCSSVRVISSRLAWESIVRRSSTSIADGQGSTEYSTITSGRDQSSKQRRFQIETSWGEWLDRSPWHHLGSSL